jgi:hypothetical protein
VRSVGRCSTTRLENAYSTEVWDLLYPWHPWSGLRNGIHEAIERPGGIAFRCDLTASDANRWLEIPAWMFDRSACAKVRLALEPHTDLSALIWWGTHCGMYGTEVLEHRMPPILAYHLFLATRIGETPMLRQSRQRSARRRVPQQIDVLRQRSLAPRYEEARRGELRCTAEEAHRPHRDP